MRPIHRAHNPTGIAEQRLQPIHGRANSRVPPGHQVNEEGAGDTNQRPPPLR